MSTTITSLAMLILLGAFHGINPGMGWLFAARSGCRSAGAELCFARWCRSVPAMRWPWHPRWVGMRVGMGGLTVWSFLMATAHGAGVMVMPVFVRMSMAGEGGHMHQAAAPAANATSRSLRPACTP